jgi:hypothetical protein
MEKRWFTFSLSCIHFHSNNHLLKFHKVAARRATAAHPEGSLQVKCPQFVRYRRRIRMIAVRPTDSVRQRACLPMSLCLCLGDFRTALQDALNHMHALSTLARSDASTGTNITGSPSSSSSMVASSAQVEKNRTDTMVRLTTILQRNLRVRYEVNTSEILKEYVYRYYKAPHPCLTIFSIMPALSDHATKESRAAAYRLIRHTLINMDSVLRLRDQHLDWYIIRFVLNCIFAFGKFC